MKYLTEKNELVKLVKALTFHGSEPFCTTRTIATKFDKDHNKVMAKIESFGSFNEMIKGAKIRPLKLTYRGQEYNAYELNADAYAFTCMSFTGKKAETFKWGILEALSIATREALTAKITADTNKINQLWNETRTLSKIAHRDYTDTIKKFCAYAEEQRGSPYSIDKKGNPTNKPCPYYIHFQRLVYQKADIVMKKGHSPKRDSLSGLELERVEMIELDTANTISDLMSRGLHYKKIFKSIKADHTK